MIIPLKSRFVFEPLPASPSFRNPFVLPESIFTLRYTISYYVIHNIYQLPKLLHAFSCHSHSLLYLLVVNNQHCHLALHLFCTNVGSGIYSQSLFDTLLRALINAGLTPMHLVTHVELSSSSSGSLYSSSSTLVTQCLAVPQILCVYIFPILLAR